MKIFYHGADLDGWCSGALVKYFYPEAELCPVNYGDAFPFDLVTEGEEVWILDFSFDPSIMRQINHYCSLTWIDHHKTAIEAMNKEFQIQLNGLQRVGIGACALVWEYMFSDSPMPTLVQYLAEYDVFNFENPCTLPFQYGARIALKDPKFELEPWIQILSKENDDHNWQFTERKWVENGMCILQYLDQSNTRIVNSLAIETEFAGYPALVVNQGLTNSMVFDGYPRLGDFPLRILCVRRPGKWSVSLYSDTVDVSHIAKLHGGGGHRGAAGFICKELPFAI